MIIKAALSLVWAIVSWIVSLFDIPSAVNVSGLVSYVHTVFNTGAGMLFYFFRPATFYAACDIVFFFWAAEPLWHFVQWVLRKLPFLNIS